MADLNIIKPQAGEHITVENVENARIVLGFSPADATLERDGDNLVFKFEDGSEVAFTGFYTAYTAANLPTFQIDGAELEGKDFFAALDENLMPAAGPSAAATRGGRFNEYDVSDLMDGIDRLDGLDLGFTSEQLVTEDLQASLGGLTEPAVVPGNASPVPPLPPVSPELPPVSPEVPPLSPEAPPVSPEVPPVSPEVPPVSPEVPPEDKAPSIDGLNPDAGEAEVTADEADISSETKTTEQSFTFTVPDGLVSATIGGVQIAEGATVQGEYGTLYITGLTGPDSDGTYTVSYQYGITENAQHKDGDGTNTDLAQDAVAESFEVSITDKGSDTPVKGYIDVEIKDDVPEFTNHTDITGIKPGETGTGSLTLAEGADGANWDSLTVNGTSVSLIDGKGELRLDNGDTLSLSLNGAELSYTYHASDASGSKDVDLNFAVKDMDGDEATQKVTVNVMKDGEPSIGGLDPEVGKAEVTADEADISSGTKTMEQSFTFTAPDGLVSATIGGVQIAEGATVQGTYGTLYITGLTGPDDQGEYTVNYQYGITENAQHKDGDGTNTDLVEGGFAESFEVSITDKGSDRPATGSIDVEITDDVPTLAAEVFETVTNETGNLPFVPLLNLFDAKNGDVKGLEPAPIWKFGNGNVTVSAGMVRHDGEILIVEDEFGDGKHLLDLRPNEYNPEGYDIRGLTIWGPGDDHREIDAEPGGRSEAVQFELNGLAYGLDLEIGCLFPSGSAGDRNVEVACISFYRDGVLLKTVNITSDDKEGILDLSGMFTEYVHNGFDKVILSALGPESDFVIRQIGFETLPEALFTTTGEVVGTSGADGFHTGTDADKINYTKATFNYGHGDKLTLVDKDGNEFTVTLQLERGTSGGDGVLTATDDAGNLIFKAVLGKDGDWSFHQYKEFTSSADSGDNKADTFDLSFITKDADGDTAITYAPIPTMHGHDGKHEANADASAPSLVPDDTPDVPDVPDAPVPDTPDVPDAPVPDTPDVPDAPVPDVPGQPNDTHGIEGYSNKTMNDDDPALNQPHSTRAGLDTTNATGHDVQQQTDSNDPVVQDPPVDNEDEMPIFYSESDETIFSAEYDPPDGGEYDQAYDDSGENITLFNQDNPFIDDGHAMDVLLGGTADLADMKDQLQNGTAENAEMLAADAKVVSLTDMDQLGDELNISRNEDGTLNMGENWSDVASKADLLAAGDGTPYVEYSNDEQITIVMQQNLIKTDSGSA